MFTNPNLTDNNNKIVKVECHDWSLNPTPPLKYHSMKRGKERVHHSMKST